MMQPMLSPPSWKTSPSAYLYPQPSQTSQVCLAPYLLSALENPGSLVPSFLKVEF